MQYTLIGILAYSAMCTVLEIGQDRKPITGPTAVCILIVNAFMIWLVVVMS